MAMFFETISIAARRHDRAALDMNDPAILAAGRRGRARRANLEGRYVRGSNGSTQKKHRR